MGRRRVLRVGGQLPLRRRRQPEPRPRRFRRPRRGRESVRESLVLAGLFRGRRRTCHPLLGWTRTPATRPGLPGRGRPSASRPGGLAAGHTGHSGPGGARSIWTTRPSTRPSPRPRRTSCLRLGPADVGSSVQGDRRVPRDGSRGQPSPARDFGDFGELTGRMRSLSNDVRGNRVPYAHDSPRSRRTAE